MAVHSRNGGAHSGPSFKPRRLEARTTTNALSDVLGRFADTRDEQDAEADLGDHIDHREDGDLTREAQCARAFGAECPENGVDQPKNGQDSQQAHVQRLHRAGDVLLDGTVDSPEDEQEEHAADCIPDPFVIVAVAECRNEARDDHENVRTNDEANQTGPLTPSFSTRYCSYADRYEAE